MIVTGTHFGKGIKAAQSDDVKIVVDIFKNGEVLISRFMSIIKIIF